jgi:hypothetical protein
MKFLPTFSPLESNPITGLDRPRGFQEVEVPRVVMGRLEINMAASRNIDVTKK